MKITLHFVICNSGFGYLGTLPLPFFAGAFAPVLPPLRGTLGACSFRFRYFHKHDNQLFREADSFAEGFGEPARLPSGEREGRSPLA
jgi:hypothetical protein